jgi:RNA polymerase sigma-70 factor (ECF subfamily)
MDEQAPATLGGLTEQLLEHGNALLRYALARVGDSATAEDLVQETLVAAVTQLAQFAGDSSMKTWLVGILRHKIMDHYRWRERHPGDHPPASMDVSDDDTDPWFTRLGAWRVDPNVGLEVLDDDPAKVLERSQLRAALQLCIAELPKKLHRVFILRELEELDPDTVCTTTNLSRDSLVVFLYRARQSLRACLQKKWVES